MRNIKRLERFVENKLNYDDVDFQGTIMKAKEIQGRKQRELDVLVKIEELDEILRSIGMLINDLEQMELNTKKLQRIYYELASVIKGLSE